MTCPSITICNTQFLKFENCEVHFLNEKKKFEGIWKNINGHYFTRPADNIQRFDYISDWAISLLKEVDVVSLEDYSMGSKGKVFNIAENTGLLKYKLYKMQKSVKLVPPTALKKYASGKGNSDKNQMYKTFTQKTKINLKSIFNSKTKNIESPINDIVDSYFLAEYAATNP